MEAEYNARHAREILEPCSVLGELVVLDDRGVWPAFEVDVLMHAETDGLRWRPARELQGLTGAPETSATPMLPIPFTARELAAFMLAGTGALVASFYGDWNNGPDPERLGEIDRDSFARRAVIDAFAAYRLAKEEVGEWESVWLQRETTRKASSREPNNAVLLKAFDEAQATWDAAYQTWLNAMVREPIHRT